MLDYRKNLWYYICRFTMSISEVFGQGATNVLSNEYLFDTAMKKLIYALVRIDPFMKIADKNSAARKYTFLPRVGSDIRNFCGEYAKKLYEVKNGLKKAAVIPFRPDGKSVYAAILREDNGCLLMVFHPLLLFVGASVDNSYLEKAIASCAEKLSLSLRTSENEKVKGLQNNDYLLAKCFNRLTVSSDTAAKRLSDSIRYLNFSKKITLTISNEKRYPYAFVDFSKLLYSFAEIVSFATNLSSSNEMTVTADFGPNFMTVIVTGATEQRITPSRKLYLDIFSTVMHCMGIGARILKTREKSFEVAVSVPYEHTPARLRSTESFDFSVLEQMLVSVLTFYGSIEN